MVGIWLVRFPRLLIFLCHLLCLLEICRVGYLRTYRDLAYSVSVRQNAFDLISSVMSTSISEVNQASDSRNDA